MRIAASGYTEAEPGAFFDWHQHDDLDELCLVLEGCPMIGHAGKRRNASKGELFLFRRGESHGFWNESQSSGPLAIVHFDAEDLATGNPLLNSLLTAASGRRVFALSSDEFQATSELFRGLHRERIADSATRGMAEMGWLHLILAACLRIFGRTAISAPSLGSGQRDVDQLLERIEAFATSGKPAESLSQSIHGYDALRHRFRRCFGISPRTLLVRMKMERSKFLLLNTSLSIKEIARQLGYERQHEFSRAFHSATKLSPTAWRKTPQ